MNIAHDTKQHLIGGSIVAFALACFICIAKFYDHGLAIAVAGPLFGWGVERYQAIRRNGAFEYRDILHTAIPFEVLAVAVWIFGP